MINDEVIEKLISSLDIVKVVGDNIELKKSGTSYKGLCPFHNDSNPSFYVNPKKQVCKCFVCGAGGDVINFYSQFKNLGFNQTVMELSQKYNVDLGINFEESYEENDKYYTIMKDAHDFFKNSIFESREALEYLSKRDFDTDLIKEYQIGYANGKRSELYDFLNSKGYEENDLLLLGLIKKNEEGKIYDTFRNRIIFPIFSPNNHIIAFGGRTLEKDSKIPKYINSPDTPIFKKSYNLFGIEKGHNIRNKNYSILMEGYIDVLTANKFDFDTSVAPLGTALTVEQAKLLKKYSSNILLCFDSDNAGQLATEKAIMILKSQGFNIKVIQYTESKDPDDFLRTNGKQKFLEKVKTSLEAFDFLYDIYLKEYDIESNIMAKDNFIKRFGEFFSNIMEEVEKELYLQKLSDKVKIDVEVLRKTIFSTKKKSKLEVKTEENKNKETHKINEIELKIIKVLFNNPNYFSLLENEFFLISKSDLFNKTLEFFKENSNTKEDLLKVYRNYSIENDFFKEYQEEISNIIMDCLIVDNEKKVCEIIKSYFRFKIKELLERNKKMLLFTPNQKKEFIQITTDINSTNDLLKLSDVSKKLNILINNI